MYSSLESMKIIAPTLKREEEATEANIADIISQLVGRHDPFAILEKTELTYIQTLWTPEGFDLEYQERDLMHHYQIRPPIPQRDVISVFQVYLRGEEYWKSEFEFRLKNIATLRYKIGYYLGAFFGGFIRGFREAREKRN